MLHTNKIVVMRDVFSKKSLGGNGATSWDPCNAKHTAEFTANNMGMASCFWTFVAQNKVEQTHWWLSLTGVLPSHIPGNASVQGSIKWEGCGGFAKHWGYHAHYLTDNSVDKPFDWRNRPTDRKHNVICMQDFQLKYSPDTGNHTDLILNAGHWGENACYPGARKVMDGITRAFAIPDYVPIKRTETRSVR